MPCFKRNRIQPEGEKATMKKIEEVCERAQYALWNRFWDNEKEVFVNHYPVRKRNRGFTGGMPMHWMRCWTGLSEQRKLIIWNALRRNMKDLSGKWRNLPA